MRLTAAANKNPVNGSTTTIAIRQTIFGATIRTMSVGEGMQSKVANMPPQEPMR